jgi:trans-aconitate 2-methyltransferase
MSYAFAHTDRARQRLEVLAEVYSASTSLFLHECLNETPSLVVDLGCGPGCTTHLLANVLQAEQVIGLDLSPSFIAFAQKTATSHVSFVCHDTTIVPFPIGPANLLYCRFLLTHLHSPQSIVERWATQLQPGGLLLIEETEWIHTQHELLAQYLEIVAALLAYQANNLYIGPSLEALTQSSSSFQAQRNRVQVVKVTTAQAAKLFWMNIQSWKRQPFIQQHYPPDLIDRIEEDLRVLTQVANRGDEIEWGMRQLSLVRV